MTTIIDGNTELLGLLIDRWLYFISQIFVGLSGFGTTMGIVLGATFVFALFLVLVGKIKLSKIVKVTKP